MVDASYPKFDYVLEREGLDKVCKYDVKKGSEVSDNPHRHEKRDHTKKLYDDITDAIGNTPLVRIKNISEKDGFKCEIRKLF